MSSRISLAYIKGALRAQFALDFAAWVKSLNRDYGKARREAASIMEVHEDTVINWLVKRTLPPAPVVMYFYLLQKKVVRSDSCLGVVIEDQPQPTLQQYVTDCKRG